MGRPPYYVAERLILWATTNWTEFDGRCVALGFDPLQLPYDRLLNLITFWLYEGLEPKARAQMKQQIEAVPIEVTRRRLAEQSYEATAAGADFLAALAASGGSA